MPCQINDVPLQNVAVVSPVNVGLTVRSIAIMLSHPYLLVSGIIVLPDVVPTGNIVPVGVKVYGSSVAQITGVYLVVSQRKSVGSDTDVLLFVVSHSAC